MAFSKIERKSIEDVLTAYCERRVPAEVRDRLRILFRIKGESVTLLESRPSFVKPTEWIETVVAQFRRDRETGNWTLTEQFTQAALRVTARRGCYAERLGRKETRCVEKIGG